MWTMDGRGFIARELSWSARGRREKEWWIVRRLWPLVAQIMNFFQTGVALHKAEEIDRESAFNGATPV